MDVFIQVGKKKQEHRTKRINFQFDLMSANKKTHWLLKILFQQLNLNENSFKLLKKQLLYILSSHTASIARIEMIVRVLFKFHQLHDSIYHRTFPMNEFVQLFVDTVRFHRLETSPYLSIYLFLADLFIHDPLQRLDDISKETKTKTLLREQFLAKDESAALFSPPKITQYNMDENELTPQAPSQWITVNFDIFPKRITSNGRVYHRRKIRFPVEKHTHSSRSFS